MGKITRARTPRKLGTRGTRRFADQNPGFVKSTMRKKDTLPEPARIRQVKLLDGFNVELTFADGVTKTVNLKKYLHGPAFEQARSDPEYFRQVFIDPIGETIAWPNTADIDADVLRYNLTASWMEKRTARKRVTKNGKRKSTQEALVAKRVYLHPRQIKLLSKIGPNLSAAIRKVVDTYQK
jgi:hypothetical protein